MRYIENRLSKGERVVAKAKLSLWIYLREVLFAIILIGASYALYHFLPDKITVSIFWYMFAGSCGVVLILFIQHLFLIIGTELVITENKLCGRHGVLDVDIFEVQLVQINSLETRIPFFGRIFGYGKVLINVQDHCYTYKNVVRPDAFIHKINLQTSRLRKQEQGENIVIKFGLATDRVKARRKVPMDEKTRAAIAKLEKKNKKKSK